MLSFNCAKVFCSVIVPLSLTSCWFSDSGSTATKPLEVKNKNTLLGVGGTVSFDISKSSDNDFLADLGTELIPTPLEIGSDGIVKKSGKGTVIQPWFLIPNDGVSFAKIDLKSTSGIEHFDKFRVCPSTKATLVLNHAEQDGCVELAKISGTINQTVEVRTKNSNNTSGEDFLIIYGVNGNDLATASTALIRLGLYEKGYSLSNSMKIAIDKGIQIKEGLDLDVLRMQSGNLLKKIAFLKSYDFQIVDQASVTRSNISAKDVYDVFFSRKVIDEEVVSSMPYSCIENKKLNSDTKIYESYYTPLGVCSGPGQYYKIDVLSAPGFVLDGLSLPYNSVNAVSGTATKNVPRLRVGDVLAIQIQSMDVSEFAQALIGAESSCDLKNLTLCEKSKW